MIYSVRFIAVLDTCIMYPVWIRDLLLWFAYEDMFTPKWSKNICDEWAEVLRRKDIDEDRISIIINRPNQAFPDALVTNYEALVDQLHLPDPKDRHVLAAAIKTNANVIVTNNLKDFTDSALRSYGLSAKLPDDFATDLIDLNPVSAVRAFRRMVLSKTKSNLDEFEVLDILRKNYLPNTADYLHSQL